MYPQFPIAIIVLDKECDTVSRFGNRRIVHFFGMKGGNLANGCFISHEEVVFSSASEKTQLPASIRPVNKGHDAGIEGYHNTWLDNLMGNRSHPISLIQFQPRCFRSFRYGRK